MLGTVSNPLKVAVIGAGPSGFYAIQALLRTPDLEVRIDLFDRLPTPYGLLRAGVAPDHQTIKRLAGSYEKIGRDPRVRFFGNVTVGRDLLIDDLKPRYDAGIYAVGNESDRKLGLPGEDLPGVHSATEFVFWYNGHPDYQHLDFQLQRARRVAVIGNGNVAVDVARILARDPAVLAKTDIADHAMRALQDSAVEEILMIGRRGPAQASFSNKEFKELMDLDGADLVVDPRYATLDPATREWSTERQIPRSVQKNIAAIQAQSEAGEGSRDRKLRCWFLTSPTAFSGGERLERVRFVRNDLVIRDGRPRPQASDEVWDEDIDLVLKAIGYRGVPIPGLPFDEVRGVIPNDAGRVLHERHGAVLPGQYVVGWAKRGPSGLIGSNRPDSRATVEALLDDLTDLIPAELSSPVEEILTERGARWVDFDDWLKLDAEELRRGEAAGKIREKFTDVEEMLAFVGR